MSPSDSLPAPVMTQAEEIRQLREENLRLGRELATLRANAVRALQLFDKATPGHANPPEPYDPTTCKDHSTCGVLTCPYNTQKGKT